MSKMPSSDPHNDKPSTVPSGAEGTDAWRESFVTLLTAEQINLHRYIVTLLGSYDAASNVLQETNLVLWRKIKEFESGTSFSAWARKVAYWQTLAYLRDRKRDKHVFSEELVRQLAARTAIDEEGDETRIALRHCLSELKPQSLGLIKERYGGDLSIGVMAEKLGEAPGAVKVRLHRIRRALQNCIKKQMMASQ
jgi:RNA polymerase sigma-70 factor, ECF subfamily